VPETATAVQTASASINGDSKVVVSSGNTLDALLAKSSNETKTLFSELRERIVAIDDSVTENPTGSYVGYRMGNNFAEVHIGKNQLKIHLRPIDFIDPKSMVDKIPDGYNWTMDRRVYLKSASELDYVVGLIEQSYKNVL
jgi:predicted transport protein